MLDLDKPQIMALFDFDVAVQCIHNAYVASALGTVQTGDVVHLAFPEANGDCHVKSGHIAAFARCAQPVGCQCWHDVRGVGENIYPAVGGFSWFACVGHACTN